MANKPSSTTELTTTCTCGRYYTHCKACGARSVYVKKFKSLEQSKEHGIEVLVVGCRTCGMETSSIQTCQAPNRDFTPTVVPYVKPEPTPVTRYQPGSKEYLLALHEYLVHLNDNVGLSVTDAIKKAREEGWVFETEEEAAARQKAEALAQPKAEEPLDTGSLDEILEQMKKEQGGLQ